MVGICRCGGGCRGCCVDCGAEVGPLDCADDDVEGAKYEGWLWEGPFRDGDDSGASISAGSKWIFSNCPKDAEQVVSCVRALR